MRAPPLCSGGCHWTTSAFCTQGCIEEGRGRGCVQRAHSHMHTPCRRSRCAQLRAAHCSFFGRAFLRSALHYACWLAISWVSSYASFSLHKRRAKSLSYAMHSSYGRGGRSANRHFATANQKHKATRSSVATRGWPPVVGHANSRHTTVQCMQALLAAPHPPPHAHTRWMWATAATCKQGCMHQPGHVQGNTADSKFGKEAWKKAVNSN